MKIDKIKWNSCRGLEDLRIYEIEFLKALSHYILFEIDERAHLIDNNV